MSSEKPIRKQPPIPRMGGFIFLDYGTERNKRNKRSYNRGKIRT